MKRLFLMAALIAAPAMAQDRWTNLSNSSEMSLYYDGSSLKTLTPPFSSGWFKYQYKTLRRDGAAYSMVLMQVNCSDDTAAIATTVRYGADGRVIISQTYPKSLMEYKPGPPDSNGARIIGLLCRGEV